MIIIDLTSGSSGSALADLRVQFRGRGFDHIDDDNEATRLLNEAYLELCDLDDWPFLEADSSGAAPLTISDLGRVVSVQETATHRPLDRTTREELIRCGVDVTSAGSPCRYYIDAGTIVRAWPVGGTLAVRYVKVPALLVDPSDTPVVPQRFRDIIVTGAVRRALLDESNTADWQAISAEYDRRVGAMRSVLLDQSADPLHVILPESGDW